MLCSHCICDDGICSTLSRFICLCFSSQPFASLASSLRLRIAQSVMSGRRASCLSLKLNDSSSAVHWAHKRCWQLPSHCLCSKTWCQRTPSIFQSLVRLTHSNCFELSFSGRYVLLTIGLDLFGTFIAVLIMYLDTGTARQVQPPLWLLVVTGLHNSKLNSSDNTAKKASRAAREKSKWQQTSDARLASVVGDLFSSRHRLLDSIQCDQLLIIAHSQHATRGLNEISYRYSTRKPESAPKVDWNGGESVLKTLKRKVDCVPTESACRMKKVM